MVGPATASLKHRVEPVRKQKDSRHAVPLARFSLEPNAMAVAHDVPPRLFLAEYWEESRRPLVGFVFVAPMIAVYEVGLLFLGSGAMRNGVDLWLRCLLQWLGFGQYFLLPALACGILLGWHHLHHDRWRIDSGVLYGMLLESMGLAWLLMALAFLEGRLVDALTVNRICAVDSASGVPGAGQMANCVLAFFGAGIYEELLFRLILLPAVIMLLQFGVVSRNTRVAAAIVVTSLLFAAAHYRIDILLGPCHLVTRFGDSFDWTSFSFRFLAGSFFSVLFLYRGFGIAAGTHAIYDIFVYML